MKKQKDDVVYVTDMLMEIDNIALFCTRGGSDDILVNYALIRSMTVLGEAAKRISENTSNKSSDIACARIIGLRNVLSHEYEDIHVDRLWQIIERDVPLLKSSLYTYTKH